MPAIKYEYKIENRTLTEFTETNLNILGALGWKLVAIQKHPTTNNVIAVFIRS